MWNTIINILRHVRIYSHIERETSLTFKSSKYVTLERIISFTFCHIIRNNENIRGLTIWVKNAKKEKKKKTKTRF